MLRVLALVPYPLDRAPSQRFRIEQWAPFLRASGVEVTFQPLQDQALFDHLAAPGHPVGKALGVGWAALRRLGVFGRLDRCDVVFLHREALSFGPALLEPLLARRRPLVFDFDDSIWLPNENPGNPLAPMLKFPGKTAQICSAAALVVTGNDYLADWARRHARWVEALPTTIATEGDYARCKVHRETPSPVVGWSGTRTTERYLHTLSGALGALSRARSVRLRAISNGVPTVPGLDLEAVPWRAAQEVDDLLSFDVGLMPQPDEEWAKGKCGLKALQYMALGIPPVVSPTGALPSIVEHGVSGFLASDEASWIAALDRLCADAALRTRVGAQARAVVHQRFGARTQAIRLARLLEEVASGADRSPT